MLKLATVSYLNALPLIDGLEADPDLAIARRVPSRLLETLESGDADIALCPVIDFQRSSAPLRIVPAGAIGCDGPALTVKLFARTDIDRLDAIAVDRDSHTSVALLRIVMRQAYESNPTVLPLTTVDASEAVLLIGDKVITAAPDPEAFPHQLDLGDAWRRLTGRPFVFAAWMTRADADLGDLPARLDRVRRSNRPRLCEIGRRYAESDGWPPDLAARYLSSNLRYDLGDRELEAVEDFWRRCHEIGSIDEVRPMRLYRGA
jgi:chorismate dehydratase